MAEVRLTVGQGAREIVEALEESGVGVVAALTDSWIGPLLDEMRRSPRLRVVDVAREEEAVAIACGAALAGGRAAVVIQNAGLLNCGVAIGSLVRLYRIPCFLLVSYRGDERDPIFYHIEKGRVTESTLEAWDVRHARAEGPARVGMQVRDGLRWVEAARGPFALLFQAGDLR